jgi:tetratricopeptide (TPR) repeat protein
MGAGPEVFSAAFPRFQSAELARAYPDFYHESPHNIFLDALASQGMVGLAVLIGLVVLGFVASKRTRATEPALAGALGAMLAAAVVAQQFTVFTLPTALLFYVTIALLAGGAGSQPAAAGDSARPTSTLTRAAGAALAALFLFFAARLIVADMTLARVKHDLDAGRIEEAIEQHGRAAAWQPPGMNAELWYSRRLAVLSQQSPLLLVRMRAAREALAAAKRATLDSEEPHNAWYNLAAMHAARNDFANTERSLRASIAAAPNWFKPHWVLAQALRQAGRLAEAEAEAAKAADLNGGKNPEVARTLEELRSRPDR